MKAPHLSEEKRGLAALLVSLALHILIFGGAFLYSRSQLLEETSDEIFSMNDTLEGMESAAQSAADPVKDGLFDHFVSKIDLVLIKDARAEGLSGHTALVAGKIRDEKMKEEGKTIPVVKNPAVKPKLISYSPVPYPTEAGGASGTVTVCFLVGYTGRPEYTSTAVSSGNRFIDSAAVDHCISWRFTPAKDALGRLVRCLVYIPVTVRP